MTVSSALVPTGPFDENESSSSASGESRTTETFSAAAYLLEQRGNMPVVMPLKASLPDLDLASLDLEDLVSLNDVYNHELSHLHFNWRVLYQAMDESVPLLERLNFLGISSRNLDEFFSVKYAKVKRLANAGWMTSGDKGWTPEYHMEKVSREVRHLVDVQSSTFLDVILPELEKEGVRILNWSELSGHQKRSLRSYLEREVVPVATPLAIDPGHPFPFISNLSLNLAVTLVDPTREASRFARVKIPHNRPRFVRLAADKPGRQQPLHFVPLEQVIKHNLDLLFPGMEMISAHSFRVTRSSDLNRNEEEADDLLELIGEELKKRKFAPVVRIEVEDSMPDEMQRRLLEEITSCQELELTRIEMFPIRGILGMSDLGSYLVSPLSTLLADRSLQYPSFSPVTPKRLFGYDLSDPRCGDEFFESIRKSDLLVHHPYQSYADSTQLFVEIAARDPKVLAIKQTLYRTNPNSPIIKALELAADSGKEVAVLVELKARFDEERNIEWAHELEDAGCHVAYGLVGLKTHCKVILVVREEEDGLRTYFHIGTGNYNSNTAKVYTDVSLFSSRQDIGADLLDLFKHLMGYSRRDEYKKLLVAPSRCLSVFLDLIDQEIKNAKEGLPARIIAKVNGLDEKKLARKLYEAAAAGVQIDLIVRGICRVRAAVPGLTENVRVVSILGRFLEHSRIFYFENAKERPLYFIGSADWLRRNLQRRVELVCPVEDKRLQAKLKHILDLCLSDRVQAWEMRADGRYEKLVAVAGDSEDDVGQVMRGTQDVLMEEAVDAAAKKVRKLKKKQLKYKHKQR